MSKGSDEDKDSNLSPSGEDTSEEDDDSKSSLSKDQIKDDDTESQYSSKSEKSSSSQHSNVKDPINKKLKPKTSSKNKKKDKARNYNQEKDSEKEKTLKDNVSELSHGSQPKSVRFNQNIDVKEIERNNRKDSKSKNNEQRNVIKEEDSPTKSKDRPNNPKGRQRESGAHNKPKSILKDPKHIPVPARPPEDRNQYKGDDSDDSSTSNLTNFSMKTRPAGSDREEEEDSVIDKLQNPRTTPKENDKRLNKSSSRESKTSESKDSQISEGKKSKDSKSSEGKKSKDSTTKHEETKTHEQKPKVETKPIQQNKENTVDQSKQLNDESNKDLSFKTESEDPSEPPEEDDVESVYESEISASSYQHNDINEIAAKIDKLMNSDGLELALNFLKDMLRKLNINITMEHFIKTRIIVGLSGGFFYDIDEESSKNSKSNTYSSEVTEDSLKIFLLSATEFKSQIDEFVGLDSGIKSHENNNSTNMRIIILQQYGRNTKGLPVIFIYIEDIKYCSYIIDCENVTPDLLDYSFRNNFKKSYLIFKSISKMTKRRMNKMILKLQNYYGEFQTSDKHSIEEACFESEKYVNEIKELVNIFKDHYNKIVKFIGMRIQKQGYLCELLGRFITNINCEFNKCVILFHETEYIEPAKFNVDKIIFKHCKIGNQLLTFNDIEMSSRHSIASYSEYVLDDDTIDFILGFCDEYQFANRWLIMLTKLFTSDQLYEIQLRYIENEKFK